MDEAVRGACPRGQGGCDLDLGEQTAATETETETETDVDRGLLVLTQYVYVGRPR